MEVLSCISFALIAGGRFLIAEHRPIGWSMSILGDVGLIIVGVAMGFVPMAWWASVFFVMDVGGLCRTLERREVFQ